MRALLNYFVKKCERTKYRLEVIERRYKLFSCGVPMVLLMSLTISIGTFLIDLQYRIRNTRQQNINIRENKLMEEKNKLLKILSDYDCVDYENMHFNDLNIHVQVKCISFCASNFSPLPLPSRKSCEVVNTAGGGDPEQKQGRGQPELSHLIGNVYIGKVLRMGGTAAEIVTANSVLGKDIIGIFTLKCRVMNDTIITPYHEVVEYPCSHLKKDHAVCAALRSFYEAHICISTLSCSSKPQYVVIFADDIFQVLPFLKLLTRRKFLVEVFFETNTVTTTTEAQLAQFHISGELFQERVSIRTQDETVQQHMHYVTNGLGVKTILVFPHANSDISALKRNIFTVSALNANIVCMTHLDYLNPHECKLLQEKGITLHFFNLTNYLNYDYFKVADAFNYVLLSFLNGDVAIPSVPITTKSFSSIEEILASGPSSPHDKRYSVYVNRNVQ
ncbi:hypothetical protein PVIIG_02612 [Plasmodium vivax India VII]|uniref:Uncharacterized protein n=4 Tax=Plasmodium vivax TaxID=5855 RepID=A5K718_PLAVS|nr:hypothetical protein, conserved [Plasmodium vivax]EDL45109.1 hypothetical protein, conserved [Plasmodium vivax]KMZ81130.1 hypothetical protein PVIIG_02612 [Plasmodium vivax India VII]KMZ87249.1 hypothetical protein PVBG_05240 [Plasmodium vivax Brazil I]KMZ93804.1 hypothetical protein PVMG_05057 [Plasmodium vivax Mauritania I]|eukprot:XP_001614836.1 hypothetical protein [Plasmodium vivax Sal-1]